MMQEALRLGVFQQRPGAANHVYAGSLFYTMTATEKAGLLGSLAICTGKDIAVAHDLYTGKKYATYILGSGLKVE